MNPKEIVLIPGHDAINRGASSGNITEWGLTSAIIGDLTFRLDKLGHIVYTVGSNTNAHQAARVNEINPDFGLELHFNNFSAQDFNGTEVMHSGSKTGILLAEKIQNSLVKFLGTRDRGIVKAHYQLDKRKPLIEIVRKTRCPFIVVEPLFLSNPDDFRKIDIQLISIALMEGILNFVGAE